MLRPYLRRRASGDTGDDRHRVARPHRRLALGELPDVPVVHVDVHKAAQPTVRGKEVRLQRCVLAGEPIEQLPHTACLELDRVPPAHRSEEHTSELQSPCNLVCRLLLEKKKNLNRVSPNPTMSRMLCTWLRS